MKRTTTTIALAIAATATILLAACSKTEQDTQPAANAPASAPDAKSKDDLARIRELMEKDEERKQAQEAKAKASQKAISDGGKAPVPTFGR